MSAIVAGESCKKCKKDFWISFGNPKWYNDVVKEDKEPCETYLEFQKFARSGMCGSCYLKEAIEGEENEVE